MNAAQILNTPVVEASGLTYEEDPVDEASVGDNVDKSSLELPPAPPPTPAPESEDSSAQEEPSSVTAGTTSSGSETTDCEDADRGRCSEDSDGGDNAE